LQVFQQDFVIDSMFKVEYFFGSSESSCLSTFQEGFWSKTTFLLFWNKADWNNDFNPDAKEAIPSNART